jgi:c-di-GMP-binding flagellar brake protein YcgR
MAMSNEKRSEWETRMAILEWIKPDQAIRVSRNEERENLFFSAIQYVREDNFDIAIPYLRTIPLVLRDNETVRVYIPTLGGMFLFNSRVMGSRFETIPMFVLTMPTNFIRIQQRNFVRLLCQLELSFAEKPPEGQKAVFSRAMSFDISGAGVSFIATRSFPKWTPMLIRFTLPNSAEEPEEVLVESRVIRSWRGDHVGIIYLAVEFMNITAHQQDLIVRYIFHRMAEEAQKE